LARGRCAVIYHHNARRSDGHPAKNEYWLDRLEKMPTVTGNLAAIRFRPGTGRTHFCEDGMMADLDLFAKRWGAEINFIEGSSS